MKLHDFIYTDIEFVNDFVTLSKQETEKIYINVGVYRRNRNNKFLIKKHTQSTDNA